MKTRILLFLTLTTVLFTACRKGQKPTDTQNNNSAITVENSGDNNADEDVIDFTMSAMDGTEQSVAKLAAHNKLTIIDFWASWCGPCRQEMPRLVKIYNDYKDRGLGIIGVSLDEDRSAWENAVSQLNMQWTQLSDLQGWNNAAAVKYGVNSIPFTIVVDSNSKVLSAGLRGERLEQFVAERLK